jgi:hypothetical protein
MAGKTITLALEGDVPLRLYAVAIERFAELVARLSEEVAPDTAIDWLIDDLQYGSAIATARGEAPEDDPVLRVVAAYATVGRALQNHEPVPYSSGVVQTATALTSILDGKVTSVRFETDQADAIIESPVLAVAPAAPLVAYGAVEGHVDTLTRRRELRFTLFDTLFDHAVSCYLQEGQEEIMRGAWGKRCLVEGVVTRDGQSGRPLAIRQVRTVNILPELRRDGYLKARGILPWAPSSPLPEETIRRLRDAS